MARIAKPKLVEITLSVRVPKHMSAKDAKYWVNNSWYGSITALNKSSTEWSPFGDEVELFPRLSKARVVRRRAKR
jgi:hypothetical protein